MAPSPKAHDQPVMAPVDVSVNDTSTGASPAAGDSVKPAVGAGTGSVTSTQLEHVAMSLPPAPVTVNVTV